MPPSEPRTFKIGLTMAGAVSAGAYTAGVIDFLLEALGEWEAAKDRQRRRQPGALRVPDHAVQLAAVSGASAGAICAAMMAASFGEPLSPVRTLPPVGATAVNRFYDAWVVRARIEDLLATDDLDTDTRSLRSVLDSSVLDRIARDALAAPSDTSRCPPFIADPLPLFLTTGNLRGVPYRIAFRSDDEQIPGHDMVMHGDYQHFYLGAANDPGLDAIGALRLDPRAPDAPTWRSLRDAALASSAFPVGLTARPISRPGVAYEQRTFLIPRQETADCFQYTPQTIHPTALALDGSRNFRFVSIDGGTYDNEPFELVHAVLREGQLFNPRSGDEADRAVLMLDPFPDVFDPNAPYAGTAELPYVVGALLGAFVEQSRFKLEELVLAQAESVFSRFLVAPVRKPPVPASDPPKTTPVAEPFPLASGSLGAFGGFLDERFRRHDFQLGRRNCQSFLRTSFVLYATNPLFASWAADLASPEVKPFVVHADSGDPANPGTRAFLPVIPLVGTAATPVPLLERPHISSADLDAIMTRVAVRIDAVVARLREMFASGFLSGTAVRTAWWMERGNVLAAIRRFIEADLRTRSLLR